jgi:small subunit ribosomal protein S5
LKEEKKSSEYIEKLVRLNRVAKVVKGGRRFSFSALIVVGDKKGNVGLGFGKANDVSEAIRKSLEKAKRNMINVPIKKTTIPHEVLGVYKGAKVLLKPAAPGTGIIAGGPVRAIMDVCGVNDILSKSLGSKNTMNIVNAAINGLKNLMNKKKIAEGRGKTVNELWS